MAVITISIPEAVLERYGRTKGKKVQEKLVNQLTRFADVGEEDRVVLVTSPVRQELEKMAGFEIANDQDLLRFVSRVAALKLEGAELVLSHGQRQNLQNAANFHGQDPGVHLGKMLSNMIFQMFGA